MMAAARQTGAGEISLYRLRAPIKPLCLGELTSLPATPAAVFAITGERSSVNAPELP